MYPLTDVFRNKVIVALMGNRVIYVSYEGYRGINKIVESIRELYEKALQQPNIGCYRAFFVFAIRF